MILDEKTIKILFFSFLIAFLAVGTIGYHLCDFNEILVAEIAREFLDTKMWAVPTLNGTPFLEKPPLVYWIVALSFKIFGINDWAARIPSLLFAIGTLTFTYFLGKKLVGNDSSGLISALLLSTTIGYFWVGREILTDSGLIFFTTGAILFLYLGATTSQIFYAFFFLFVCGAFFCKGFVGFVVPGITFIFWILFERRWKELSRTRFWLYIPLIFLPIFLWFLELRKYEGADLLKVFLVHNHLYRFLPYTEEYTGGHREPFYFYFKYLPLLSFPWIVFLAVRLKEIWKLRTESPVVFLLSWFLGCFLFFSVAGTKRPVYLAPVLPALSILCVVIYKREKKENLLFKFGVGFSLLLLSLMVLFMPKVNEKFTVRPVLKDVAPLVDRCPNIYSFRPQEVLEASIPFYLGKYFIPIKSEEELIALTKKEKDSCLIIFVMDEYQAKNRRSDVVSKYFTYCVYKGKMPIRRDFFIFSNKDIYKGK